MPYVSGTELALILPAAVSIGTDTRPLTLAEVASILTEISAEIDAAAAAAGYAVPIATTATTAWAQLQRITKQGGAAQVLDVYAPNPSEKVTTADRYRKAYEDALERLRSGKLPLLGAGAEAGGGGRELPRSYETSNVGATDSTATPMLSIHSEF